MVKEKHQGRPWRDRWAWWPIVVLLLLIVAVGLVVLWVEAPTLYQGSGANPDAQATASATTRAGILAVFAATIAALGAVAALAETRRANRETHEREREAQVTDRYIRAIGQLGEKLEVRLGGIYALQRIAEDSPRDRPTIVDVLCAFVRDNVRTPTNDGAEVMEAHPPPSDVQAALTVIGHLNQPADREADGELYGIDLSDVHLEHANLVHANLEHANLGETHLENAKLRGAHLENANLFSASLKKADLREAHLNHADLTSAKLQGADLRRAHLEDVERSAGINLEHADLRCAHLERANLSNALLTGANLSGAHLEEADMSGTWLGGANLSVNAEVAEDGQWHSIEAAHLRGTRFGKFIRMVPKRAHLKGAHVEGVDLSLTIGLHQSQVDQAIGDERTQLPEGLAKPASWISPSSGAD
jgi:uncharacterized protein YjbI with pentapeptide repeats